MNSKENTEGKENINNKQTPDNESVIPEFETFDASSVEEIMKEFQRQQEASKASEVSGGEAGADNSSASNAGEPDENSVDARGGLSESERLKKELAEANDRYLRLAAEFDNFRKRTSRERSELFKTANKDVLVAIIPVLDDLDRAEKFTRDASDIKAVKEGVGLIASKLRNVLSQQGLKEMKSIGEPFDTDKHEAITNIPAPNPSMAGKVIDETEKGYLLGDKVIRFAKVVVGQ